MFKVLTRNRDDNKLFMHVFNNDLSKPNITEPILWDSRSGTQLSIELQEELEIEKNTQEEKRVIAKEKQEALILLQSTDWYIIRKLERNVEIPSEVTTKRLNAISILNK